MQRSDIVQCFGSKNADGKHFLKQLRICQTGWSRWLKSRYWFQIRNLSDSILSAIWGNCHFHFPCSWRSFFHHRNSILGVTSSWILVGFYQNGSGNLTLHPPSATQRMSDRVFGMRKILWPSHRRNCCRLSQSVSTAKGDSKRTPNQKKCIHWWYSERSLHFSPPGSVARCRLWRLDILRQLQWAKLRHPGICSALIWRLN